MTAKELLLSIKENFNSEEASYDFFETYSSKKELGIISIDKRNKKFDLRGEKTPSCKAYKNLTYVDFGGEGKKRDVIYLMMENDKNLSFSGAVQLLANWLNEDTTDLVKKSRQKIETSEKVAPYTEFYVNSQMKERAKPENKEIYTELVKGLFRGCSIDEMRAGCKAFDIGLNKFETEEGTQVRLFIPEYDENKIAWGSYRYNRNYTSRKGLLRKNCKRILFGSHLLKFYNKEKPIIVSEGHSDVVVNVAKYLQCVTSGSSTAKIAPFLPLLKGRELHFYPDADQPGLKGVTHKIMEIEQFNISLPFEEKITYKVFFWGKGFIDKSIEEFESLCVPMSDIKTSAEKYSKSWWLNHFDDKSLTSTITLDVLQREQELLIQKLKKEEDFSCEIPSKIWINNWSLVSKEIVPCGFDFIDFHIKHNGSKNYQNFISKYKFK